MGASNRVNLLDAPAGPTLLKLAGPMVVGILAIILFTVVDTFYVGQLGAVPLAAMGFIFPVVFFVMSISIGMGVGVTAVVSRVIGEGDTVRVRCLTTDGLILANLTVVAFAVLGLVTLKPLFRALGADATLQPLIEAYMIPWYIGIGFLVIPMVGNAAIRATGDTKTPAIIMIIAGVVNIILDPLLIFGLGPFPRLELQGAAVATVISWTVTFFAALTILAKREHMIEFALPPLARLLASWKQILYIAVPASATQALIPLGTGVLTRIIAGYGNEAVAAFGVGMRIEAFSLVGIMALGAATTPFTGMNFGANNCSRIRDALRFNIKAALVYGAVVAALLAALAPLLASVFNDDPTVRSIITRYLWMVPFSYGLYGVMLLINPMFNGLNKPLKATVLIVLRLFVLAVPLALAGSRLWGLNGIFAGVAAANVMVGVASVWSVRKTLAIEDERIGAEVATGVVPDAAS